MPGHMTQRKPLVTAWQDVQDQCLPTDSHFSLILKVIVFLKERGITLKEYRKEFAFEWLNSAFWMMLKTVLLKDNQHCFLNDDKQSVFEGQYTQWLWVLYDDKHIPFEGQ